MKADKDSLKDFNPSLTFYLHYVHICKNNRDSLFIDFSAKSYLYPLWVSPQDCVHGASWPLHRNLSKCLNCCCLSMSQFWWSSLSVFFCLFDCISTYTWGGNSDLLIVCGSLVCLNLNWSSTGFWTLPFWINLPYKT